MSIDELLVDAGPDIYYTDKFHIEIESHFPRLLDNDLVSAKAISNHQAMVYDGDMFGLLRELGVPEYAHYTTMRLNGFDSPSAFTKNTTTLIIPFLSELDSIEQVFNSNSDAVI